MTFWDILWVTLWVEAGLFTALLLCAPYQLWCDYAGVMNLKRVRDKAKLGEGPPLTRWETQLGTYLLVRGYLLDLLVNTIHATVRLREWPRELTVTARLNRHINSAADSWRRALCLRLRTGLLNNLDPRGVHT